MQGVSSQSGELSVIYYNARSLIPKIDELRAIAEAKHPDIICIVESWLSNEIQDNELVISNYQLARLDRNRHGGGILIYVHTSLVFDVLSERPSNLELLAISVNSPCSSHKFCIALFYRPPSSDVQIFSQLFSFLESLSPTQFSTFLLLGDFNIDFLKPHHPLFHKLSDILYSFSLEQVVPSYTHVSPNGSTSLIDLAFLSTPTLLRSCSVIPPLANSDHFGLLLDIKWKTNTKQARSEKRKIWRYAHADFQKACQLIDSTDWDSILCHDVDQSILQWNNCFLNIMEQCIPKATLGRRRNLPWLTKNISSAIRKRNYLFNRAKSSGRRDHVEKYKRMRNRVTTMLRNGKKLFFQNLNPHNNKQFWKAMKYLRKQTSSIPNLSYNNNVVSSMDQEKANMLNDYFSKCFNRSQPPLQTTDCLNYPLADDCPDEILCTESEVTALLMTLDISKASGPDGISARMLRETAEHISPSLTKIFNLSIKTGSFPSLWKKSNIVPIPKANDNHNPSNYRPISLLSILGKLLEKHVHHITAKHVSTNPQFANVQWGFQSGKSTVTALLATTYDWFQMLDSGKEVCAVFFDIQKAFDTIPHHALMQKLQYAGLNNHILHWICSYLTESRKYL